MMPKVLILMVFITAIALRSLVGFCYLVVVFITLLVDHNNKWRSSWMPISLLSVLFVNIEYIFQLLYINGFITAGPKWEGLVDKQGDKLAITNLSFFFALIVVSWMQSKTNILKVYLEPQSNRSSEDDKPLPAGGDDAVEAKKEEAVPERSALINDDEPPAKVANVPGGDQKHSKSVSSVIDDDSDEKEEDGEKKRDPREIFADPIIWCNQLWKMIDGTTNLHGSSLSLTLIIFLGLYRVNIVSVFYAVLVALSFVVAPRHTYLFRIDDPDKERRVMNQRRRKSIMWTLLVVCQILFIAIEYSFLLFVNDEQLKKHFTFYCNPDGKNKFSPIKEFSHQSDYVTC